MPKGAQDVKYWMPMGAQEVKLGVNFGFPSEIWGGRGEIWVAQRWPGGELWGALGFQGEV